MIDLVTFATDDMARSAMTCIQSARRHGIERFEHFNGKDLERLGFYENRPEWRTARGAGYWAWKPYLIDRQLSRLNNGDILIYSDVGIEFIDNVNYIVDRMEQDIFLFGNMWEHAHWCKRDIVEAIWPLPIDRQSFVDAGIQMSTPTNLVAFDVEGIENLYSWARFGKQAQASVIFFRVSDYTRQFVKEWLDWCLAGYTDSFPPFATRYLIDDSPSFNPNHPEFRENRHDQAILTTMAYRDGIKLHWWPAMYNDGAFVYERGDYPDEGYPVLFHHHRRRNHEWSVAA